LTVAQPIASGKWLLQRPLARHANALGIDLS
jgi:hypothetical protein